ncbi:DUF5777 family beta-barrel protein [Reichenbachiella versicolor]|uniref:DUF5777 family beta-barrel protein n=1 Tax=Reichenbachiella versicolor TaxID=1821036 RepID=UPI000D6E2547|nr:DUF5777 family beta-barrel protein [Reichenbachiella versicolor]
MKKIVLALALFSAVSAYGQDDLMSMLDTKQESKEVTSTFKASRLVSGQTVRTLDKNTLDFVINHRFGAINSGVEEFWGLDDAQIRLGLEYGVTDDLMVGIGRSSYEKTVDGYLKYKILSQQTSGVPVTVTGFASMAIKTDKDAFADPDYDYSFSQKTSYAYQLLVARKFNSKLSLQLMPTLIHRNLVVTANDSNDVVALGVGGRYKFTPRVSFNVEYYPQFNNTDDYTDALSLGVDIETGGHVFQLHVSNSRAMIEKGFVAETTGEWGEGDLFFGFNISRSFALGKKKKDW